MERIVLDNIPIEITIEDVLDKLRLGADFAEELEPFREKTAALMRPKAILRRIAVSGHAQDGLELDGTRFTSRVMAVNLKDKTEAVGYVVTCGRELHELSQGCADSVERFWQDSINELVLSKAMRYVNLYVEREMGLSPLSAMSPGSLEDWPITMQRPLFDLIGGVFEDTGVELNPSFLMVPIKSVSGIFFQSDEHYTNCMLCPKVSCPNRRDAFNEGLYKEKYGMGSDME